LPQCCLFRQEGVPENEILAGNDDRDLERALELQRQGKSQLAEAYLSALLERVPLSFRVHRARQDLWFEAGPKGREKKQTAYGSLPEDTAFDLTLKARIQQAPARARALLERAVAQDPSFVWGLLGLGFVERRADQYEQAREHLIAALDVWREFPEALHDL